MGILLNFYLYEFWLTGKVSDWNFTLHELQLCFGVKEFLVCFDLASYSLYDTGFLSEPGDNASTHSQGLDKLTAQMENTNGLQKITT